ncbi:MAG TPA: hypothetical protein VFO36_09160, partial [Nitrospiraceae bacterium]|nr:hypothetical protein [Nitrospiraceae bacterium]
DPAGSSPSKKTEFEYQDEPTRRTTVVPPDAPHLVYDIGFDGSVLKWWNKLKAPTIEPLIGSLYASRETSQPISAGDYYLTARAWSAEGIASIDIVVNGNQLVDEMTCEQDPEKQGLECVNPPPVNEWVTETGEHAPGILHVEVLATDRIGNSSSERFWVNIPEPPPPPANGIVPPKFKDIKEFREERGLEVVFPVANEIQLNERIFNLIGAWHSPQSPAGQVARASWERWGVPLRPEDVAELEYRLRYWRQAMAAVPTWSSSHAASSFAGFYLDERAGGKIKVGFTGGTEAQETLVDSLVTSGATMAPDRIDGFSHSPQHSLAALESLAGAVQATITQFPSNIASRAFVNVPENRVTAVASNVAESESRLKAAHGTSAPISVISGEPLQPRGNRSRIKGSMLAGDRVFMNEPAIEEDWGCSAGYGAYDQATNPVTGRQVFRMFLLLAAHCGEKVPGTISYRESPPKQQVLGTVKRSAWDTSSANLDLDVEAVRYEGVHGIEPRKIFNPQEGA